MELSAYADTLVSIRFPRVIPVLPYSREKQNNTKRCDKGPCHTKSAPGATAHPRSSPGPTLSPLSLSPLKHAGNPQLTRSCGAVGLAGLGRLFHPGSHIDLPNKSMIPQLRYSWQRTVQRLQLHGVCVPEMSLKLLPNVLGVWRTSCAGSV